VINEYGLPYPAPTDSYAATPTAIADLASAIAGKLVNLPIQFIPAATYPTNGNGDATVNLSGTFAAVDGAVVSNSGGGTPVHVQVVAGAPAGMVQVRVMTLAPPDGAVIANGSATFALTAWGTPR
jgi:hypothetical protein